MSTPTPGPYPLKITQVDDLIVIVTNQGNLFANTFDPAAARLIVSAPELLMALQMALPAVEYFDEHEGGEIVLEVVRTAIAKARGGGAR